MKMNTFEKILGLLRCELWEEQLACEVTADDIDGILAMAEEQGVNGLVANAIIGSNLPIGDVKTVDVCTVQRLHELKCRDMNKKVSRFAAFLNRRELKYAVMKGQTMATLYPHPLMRSCGDIDFYCPKDSFKEVQRVIEERLGVEMHHNWSERHDNFVIKDCTFEMHSDMMIFGARSHQRYWDSFFDEALASEPSHVVIDEIEVKTLSPTLDALYIFTHLFGHFVMGGSSLKQWCDWAMVLHCYRDEIRKEELERHLQGLGLLKAYRAMGFWLVEKLGLPEEEFPFALEDEDKRWLTKLHRNVMTMRGENVAKDRKIGHHVSMAHTLMTASLVARQSVSFFRLAPKEMFWTFPKMASWSVRKRL